MAIAAAKKAIVSANVSANVTPALTHKPRLLSPKSTLNQSITSPRSTLKNTIRAVFKNNNQAKEKLLSPGRKDSPETRDPSMLNSVQVPLTKMIKGNASRPKLNQSFAFSPRPNTRQVKSP